MSIFISIPLLANCLDSLERHIWGVKPGVTIQGEDMGGLLPEEVRGVVEHMAVRYQKLPSEPELDKKTGEIIPEENGSIVNIEGNIAQIKEAQEGEALDLETFLIYPQYTREDIEAAKEMFGTYETWINGSQQRHSNIALAAGAINNTLLWPDEIFSFNEVVGPRSAARGYLPAPIIIMGKTELDYGGGVCQVSSTVFNAAEMAGLQILEHHAHSKAIYYVPEGRDAAVTYGYLDLKFENTLEAPIIMKAGLSGNKVWVNILGRKI